MIQMNELGAYFAIKFKNCQIAFNALYKKISLNATNALLGISYMHLFVMIVSNWIKIVKSASKADVLNAFQPIFLTKKSVHCAEANIRNV
jgi:hypothetical protein